jgi:hypothetical protein
MKNGRMIGFTNERAPRMDLSEDGVSSTATYHKETSKRRRQVIGF